MIIYQQYTKAQRHLKIADGFFDGWANSPCKDVHREILERSYKAYIAVDSDNSEIIGFINVISDGVISAYIPLLEVIPSYKKRGIGKKLVEMAIAGTENLYMVDLTCDDNLVNYYKKFGMHKSNCMFLRNYNAFK